MRFFNNESWSCNFLLVTLVFVMAVINEAANIKEKSKDSETTQSRQKRNPGGSGRSLDFQDFISNAGGHGIDMDNVRVNTEPPISNEDADCFIDVHTTVTVPGRCKTVGRSGARGRSTKVCVAGEYLSVNNRYC